MRNWAGNLTYSAARVHRPQSVPEVQAAVAGAARVRALGTRHSFSDVADTSFDLVSTEGLVGVEAVEENRVTVLAGTRYGELGRFLDGKGLAVHNLASLPHISVAGACATATHGSGDGSRSLAAAVVALDVVTADGEVVRLEGDECRGAAVGLGGLGVVVRVTLECVPAFDVRQDLFETLSLDALAANFDAVTGRGLSVSLFTDWRQAGFTQVWVKRRAEEGGPGEALFGATPARGPLHPIPGAAVENCTAQMGVPGPSHERLPHFRLEFTPSSGEELQAEYLVPRPMAIEALRAIAGMRERIAPLLQISEVRTVAADELWLSPCYGTPCVSVHFTLKPDGEAVGRLLPEIEAALAPFEPRPHWGKLFTMAPEIVRARYPRLSDFRELLRRYDPAGKFRNAFLDRYVG